MINNTADNPFVEEGIAEIYDRHSPKYHCYEDALKEFTRNVPLKSRILEMGVSTGASSQYFNWNFENGVWIIGKGI